MAVWTGNGDGVSWSDPNNWSPVGVPAPYQSVTIAQVGSDPVSVLVAAGQTEAGNPLILGAAGTSEAVTLTNDGTFSNYAGVTIYAGTTLDNAGKMTLNGFTDDGTMINSGQLTVNGNVAVSASGLFDTLAGGVSSVSGTIAVAGTLEVGGTLKVATALTGAGSVLVDGGTLTSGSGGPAAIGNSSLAFTISNGGTLSVTPPPGTVSFAFGPSAPGQVNTLIVPSYSGTITGQITNFGPGDMISTGGRSSTGSATFNGTDYTVVIGSVTLDHVALAPGLTGSSLTFGSGTVGAAACYLKGTRILTDLGPIPIERLREGDLVLTASGSKRPIRWIGRRHYPAQVAAANPDIRPVLIRAGALGVGALGEGVPRRDLFVSPRHAMFLDGMLIAAMHLANGVSVLHGDWVGDVTYLHLELDSHDILFAEGAASESFVDEDSRHIFDNAASFQANPMAAPARACAARIEDGFALEAVRARIDALAGLDRAPTAPHEAPQEGLRGHLDVAGGRHIVGWAQNAEQPEVPATLLVMLDGETVARVLANAYRRDVAQAGFGQGRHGFEVRLPPACGRVRRLDIRRESDGAALPGSPWYLDAALSAPSAPEDRRRAARAG